MNKEQLDRMIDKNINVLNMRIFNCCGTRNPSDLRHVCVFCKTPVSIEGSKSMRGNRLICRRCQLKFFNNEYEVSRWIGNFEED